MFYRSCYQLQYAGPGCMCSGHVSRKLDSTTNGSWQVDDRVLSPVDEYLLNLPPSPVFTSPLTQLVEGPRQKQGYKYCFVCMQGERTAKRR